MRFVMDTNQFVSAFLSPDGNQARLVNGLEDARWEIVVSPSILAELRRVLFRPHIRPLLGRFSDAGILETVAEIEHRAVRTDDLVSVRANISDPDDNIVLACALEGEADFIVTGDEVLLNLKEFHRIRIVTASDMLQILDKLERR